MRRLSLAVSFLIACGNDGSAPSTAGAGGSGTGGSGTGGTAGSAGNTDLVWTSSGIPLSVTVGNERAYVPVTTSLWAIPKEGGDAVLLSERPSADGQAGRPVIDTGRILWPTLGQSADTLWEAPLAGGAAVAVAEQVEGSGIIEVEDGVVYWSMASGGVLEIPPGGTATEVAPQCGRAFTIEGGVIFCSDGDAIVTLPLDGEPEQVATETTEVLAVTVDATNVYWLTFGPMSPENPTSGAAVKKAPRVGGDPETLWSHGWGVIDLPDPNLVSDRDDLFIVLFDELVRIPKAGGQATVLATSTGALPSVAVDATHAWFVEYIAPDPRSPRREGRLRRVPR